MLRLVLNRDHLTCALAEALNACRHRLFIATADVKDVQIPAKIWSDSDVPETGVRSILRVFEELSHRDVEVRLLHSGIPSSAFLKELRSGVPKNLTMRRCPRVHVKAVIADGRYMYLGSANLTGAGIGAKSARRRNFEAGIWTDETTLIDPVTDMLDGIFSGSQCDRCGRKEHCPAPLEEPDL